MTRSERNKLQVGDLLRYEEDDRTYVIRKHWMEPVHNWMIAVFPVGEPEFFKIDERSTGL